MDNQNETFEFYLAQLLYKDAKNASSCLKNVSQANETVCSTEMESLKNTCSIIAHLESIRENIQAYEDYILQIYKEDIESYGYVSSLIKRKLQKNLVAYADFLTQNYTKIKVTSFYIYFR